MPPDSRWPPSTVHLMLSPFPGEKEALASVQAGASGLLSIDVPRWELVHALRMVSAGGYYFGTEVVAEALGSPHEGSPRAEQLTDRERRIVAMLADGMSNQEIGEALGLAPETVRNALTRVRTKLGVTSRTRLVRFAYEHRLNDGGLPQRN